MRRALDDARVRFYIGDVRDYDSVDGPRAASTTSSTPPPSSRCPVCEFFPLEAVRTNVIGSANVIEASNANGVRSVVCLGTDKAAYPVNAMGMSKAMMEKVAQAFARNNPTAHTVVSTVRYGNVMMSRGSVIPLFVEQIRAGQSADGHRPAHDPLPDVAGRGGPARRARLRARQPGDLFIRKAPASHDRGPGQGRRQGDGRRARRSR